MEPATIYGSFSSAVAAAPDRPFLVDAGKSVSYAEASRRVDEFSALLDDHGVEAGDHVAILSSNDPAFVYLLLAAANRGATLVPLDYRQEGEVLSYLLEDADPSVLVVDESAYDRFVTIAPRVEIETVLHRGVDEVDEEATLRYGLDNVEVDGSPGDRSNPNDVAIVNYTSGSTGPPKGVQNPHRAFVEAGRWIADRCGTGPDDRGLIVLPLFHANPLTYGLMHVLARRGSLALVDEFSASGFWQFARETESTFFTHVGSVLEILHRTASSPETDTDTPLEFTLGGAAQFENQRAFEEETGVQIVRLYGLSEVGGGVVTMNPYREGTVHGAAHQGSTSDTPFDVRVLDESGTDYAERGETGEIVVRPGTPGTMFVGYLGKPSKTVSVWRDLWMHTGDLGWIDEGGNLHYVGRRGTVIRKMGENISPWEIETVVNAFDCVAEAVAVGVPDPVAGDEIKLCVVPSGSGTTESSIHERCLDELPDHHVPRYVELIEEVPRTSTQKVERRPLEDVESPAVWDSEAGGR